MGFSVPNKPDVTFPRQSQIHQADVTMVSDGLHDNGVLKGCEIESVGGMELQLVQQSTLPIYATVENMIVHELIVYDVDRIWEIQMSLATPQLLTISDGDATYDRFDLVWASPGGIFIEEGTPAAIPIKERVPLQVFGPATGRALGVALYEVYVPSGATSLDETNLEDKRVFVNRPRDHYVWIPLSASSTGEPAGGQGGIA